MSETIQTKRCAKCKQIKPISEFYKHPNRGRPGFRGNCKECEAKKYYRHNGMKCVMTEAFAAKTKICKRCKTEKPISDYYVNPRSKDGLQYTCKKCECEMIKQRWERKTPKEKKNINKKRLKRYHRNIDNSRLIARCSKRGVTKKQWLEMFRAQNGKCAICGVSHLELNRALAVDHNHITKKVRELLCVNCNSILGHCKDNVVILGKAIEYLEKHEVTSLQKVRFVI